MYDNEMIGLLWGILFDSTAFVIGVGLYRLHSPWQKIPFFIMFVSCLGHFVGTWYLAQLPSDASLFYFPYASPEYKGLGHLFVANLVWYVRDFITGDSFLGTLYFFSIFACLGSVLWYLFYLQLSRVLQVDVQRSWFPALVIMCLPSFFFFTSGMKDSICFFVIPVVLMLMSQLILRKKPSLMVYCIAIPLILLMLLVRPYLAMLFAGGFFLSKLMSSSGFLLKRGLWLGVAVIPLFYIVQWLLRQVGIGLNLADIGSYMLKLQLIQSVGTSFPILASGDNPVIMLLLLPYGFVMNLIMPLFVFANSTSSLAASLENILLVFIIVDFWRKRKTWAIVKMQCPPVKLCIWFFFTGMLFLAALNTNLGLSMREKSMYVPAFLIAALLVWSYDRRGKGSLSIPQWKEPAISPC